MPESYFLVIVCLVSNKKEHVVREIFGWARVVGNFETPNPVFADNSEGIEVRCDYR